MLCPESRLPRLAIAGLVCIAAVGEAKLPELPLHHERFVLPNGLTVVVNEDRSAPVVSVQVEYRVGSRNEPAGQTGFAHLFEHLMFNGSEHYEGEWFAPLLEVGATSLTLGGGTGKDSTSYYQTVPTPALDRVLWMESDRMGHLLGAVTQAKLDEQRGVVQNELREGENRPYGRLHKRLAEALFPPGHPYHHPIIGSMVDLNAASLEQVKQWFRDYYGPNNAVLVLSGDIDAATAREKVERYFGDIPPSKRLDTWTRRAPARAYNTREIQYDAVVAVRAHRAWVIPDRTAREHALLALAAAVLGQGRNGLLPAELVHQRQRASMAFATVSSQQLAGQFYLWADLKPGVDAAVATEAMDRLVAEFLARGPTQDELERAIATVISNELSPLENADGRARALAVGELDTGDPAFLSRYLGWIDSATVQDVRDAARRHLAQGWHQIDVLPRGEFKASGPGVDRSKGLPAVPATAPTLNFPNPHVVTLPNGLRLVIVERQTSPRTLVSIRFDAGNAADLPDKPGVASFTVRMLNEGTGKEDALTLSARAARLGTEIYTSTDLDASAVGLVALPGRLAPSMALLGDIVQNASFAQDAIERVRAERLATLQSEQSDPQQIAFRILRKLSFGEGHGYGIPRSGLSDEASIRSVTREDLLAFRRHWLRPDNATIFVVGNTTVKEARSLVERALGGWRAPATPVPQKNAPQVTRPSKPRLILVDRPGAAQSLILGGDVIPGAGSANELAIQIVNSVLGKGFTSRLNMNLREDKQWSYGAGTGMADARGQRSLQVNAPVQTDRTGDALAEILRELETLNAGRPITQTEMNAAVSHAIRELPGAFETAGSVLSSLAASTALGRPLDEPNTRVQLYQALSLQDVQAAAREIIDPRRMIWIVVGDRGRIESPLAALNLAPIEHWTAGGRKIE